VTVLGEREIDAVRTVLADLARDVEVTLELGPSATPVTLLTAGGREVDTSAETRAAVEEVCAVSDRVHLSIVEHSEPGRWPRTTIGPGLGYLGMPLGYELTTLVYAIVLAGSETPVLSAPSLEQLAALDDETAIAVYVTPT
jgi:alkyl hydroperoxide reductase subunit AhpF